MLKCCLEVKYWIFGLFKKQRRYSVCMYLALRNVKVRSKKGHQWSEKAKSKEWLVFFEVKMKQDTCCWWKDILSWHKQHKQRVQKGRKQETRYCSCFSMINCLQKGSNCIIEPCETRNKTQCMYLSFKNPKISSSKGQYWWEI